MLRTFDSPHIMKLEAIFESENSIYIILELLADGQLHSRINEKMAIFSEEEVKCFLRGMGKALYEIHRYRVMHRDIKPENIMLRGKTGLNPVLVDFGLAADVDSDDYMLYRCGTPGYVAPEIISSKKGDKINPECDIFSLGIIFHILLLKRPLFEGKTQEEVYEKNKRCEFNLNTSAYRNVDGKAMDLLRRMLKVDPSERITSE
jgi:serine/threonine protein kinase